MEFIHGTRRPFRLMDAHRNFCSRCCRRHWDCQASHTHATVKSSAAQHVFQPECDVNEALQTFQSVDLDWPRLLRISLGLQTGFVSRVVLRPWWFRLGPRFCYGHEININVGYRRSRTWPKALDIFATDTLSFWLPLVFRIPPEIGQ